MRQLKNRIRPHEGAVIQLNLGEVLLTSIKKCFKMLSTYSQLKFINLFLLAFNLNGDTW